MKKCLVFALFAVLSLFLLAEAAPSSFDNLIEKSVRYDGAQLWNVNYSNEVAKEVVRKLIEEHDVDLLASNSTAADVFLKQSAIDKVRQVLEDNNIQYSVKIEDVQKLIDSEAAPIEVNDQKSDNRLTWNKYYSTEDIYKYLDYLVEKYPNLCSVQTIGHTYENRSLNVLKISNGNSGNKAIWMDAGIHAREWISSASVTYIVNDLVENWDSQPDHIKNVNWYVLPVHNPDGYEYTRNSDRMWRKNRSKQAKGCYGVDLNRNFGFKWGGIGTAHDPCDYQFFGGTGPFSELEPKAVKNFIENSNEKFDAFLTFHSYGQWILYPWGFDRFLTKDHKDLARVANEGAKNMLALDNKIYTTGSSAILMYPAAGGSDDWAKSIGVKYSYTVELRDKGRYGFDLPTRFIEPTGKEARAFVFTVAQAIAEM